MSLPRMGHAAMPRKCYICTFCDIEVPVGTSVIGALTALRTYCAINPDERRELKPFVATSVVDHDCPLWDEMDPSREDGDGE